MSNIDDDYITKPWIKASIFIRKNSWYRSDHMGIIFEDVWGGTLGICSLSGSLADDVQKHHDVSSGEVKRGISISCSKMGCGDYFMKYVSDDADVRNIMDNVKVSVENNKLIFRRHGSQKTSNSVCRGTWKDYDYNPPNLKMSCPITKIKTYSPVVLSVDKGGTSSEGTISEKTTNTFSVETTTEFITQATIESQIKSGSGIEITEGPVKGGLTTESSIRSELSTTWRKMITTKQTTVTEQATIRKVTCGKQESLVRYKQKRCGVVELDGCSFKDMKYRYRNEKFDSGDMKICKTQIQMSCVGEDGKIGKYKVLELMSLGSNLIEDKSDHNPFEIRGSKIDQADSNEIDGAIQPTKTRIS
jgi:hypothetical protein